MKKNYLLIMIFCLMISLSACGKSQQNTSDGESKTTQQETQQETQQDSPLTSEAADTESSQADEENADSASDSKVLVAYFAYSENMGDTSGMTADAITSASLNEKTSNSDGNLQVMVQEAAAVKDADLFSIQITDPYDPDYNTMTGIAQKDQRDGKEFSFVSEIGNFGDYDTVYIGIPVWWGELPQPMVSFFEQYDFSGKTIIPFGIHLGSGFGSMIGQMKELEPDATILEGFTISADTDNDKVRAEFDAFLETVD